MKKVYLFRNCHYFHFVEHQSTLFRGNSLTTKVLSMYSLQVAREYLRGVLLSPLNFVLSDPHGYEVDASKAKDEDIQANLQKLQQSCQYFLDCINSSIPRYPT